MVGALKCKQIGEGQFTFCVDESGLVDRLFITDPRQWQVASLEANRVVGVGIVVRQVDSCVPLVEAGLLHYGMKLTTADVLRLIDLYGIACERTLQKLPLLKILALHVKNDPEFVKAVVQDKEEISVVEQLVEDPTFGAAFADLDPNDTQEFADIKKRLKAIMDRRLGRDLRMKRRIEVKRLKSESARCVRPRVGPAPPAAAVAAAAVVAGPPLPLGGRRRPLELRRRQERWDDAGHFLLAEVHSRGELKAQTVECKLPGHMACSKSVNLGQSFTVGEARRLIMQWCIDGVPLTGRAQHMAIKPPQDYPLSEIPSEHELLELANAVP